MTAAGTAGQPLRVAVVGSGPAGFYATLALLNERDRPIEVDLFDRLPTPYGLVRGGVAPDHQKTKSVIKIYEKCAELDGFRFFGNVKLGRDVGVRDLHRHYHAIVYALGNESDRRMGVPGEDLRGVTAATAFVGWYNAHPDYRNMEFDFSCKRVAVVGNGNVAVDVARILAKTAEELQETDIADHALEALRQNRITEIVMLGRRGPVQAAFTPAELRELAALSQTGFVLDASELQLDPMSRSVVDAAPPKAPVRRNLEVLEAGTRDSAGRALRNIRMRFCVSPVEFLGDPNGRVRAVRLERNKLQADGDSVRARGTGQYEELAVDWVFVSIGYMGMPVPDVPFDARRGVIPNRDGRVLNPERDALVPYQYVVGWAQSGPRGLIGIHKKESAAVVQLMREDWAAGRIPSAIDATREAIPELLRQRGVCFVTFEDWKRIDAVELERGQLRGSPRVKFSTIPEMLDVARRQ